MVGRQGSCFEVCAEIFDRLVSHWLQYQRHLPHDFSFLEFMVYPLRRYTWAWRVAWNQSYLGLDLDLLRFADCSIAGRFVTAYQCCRIPYQRQLQILEHSACLSCWKTDDSPVSHQTEQSWYSSGCCFSVSSRVDWIGLRSLDFPPSAVFAMLDFEDAKQVTLEIFGLASRIRPPPLAQDLAVNFCYDHGSVPWCCAPMAMTVLSSAVDCLLAPGLSWSSYLWWDPFHLLLLLSGSSSPLDFLPASNSDGQTAPKHFLFAPHYLTGLTHLRMYDFQAARTGVVSSSWACHFDAGAAGCLSSLSICRCGFSPIRLID